MSNIRRLYGKHGEYIGYVQEDSSRTMAFSANGGYLGSHWKSGDQTRTSKGDRVCFGNGAESLVINSSLTKK